MALVRPSRNTWSASKKMNVTELTRIAEEYGVSHDLSGIAEVIAGGRKTIGGLEPL